MPQEYIKRLTNSKVRGEKGLVITTEGFVAIRVVVLYIPLMKDTVSDEEPHRTGLRA